MVLLLDGLTVNWPWVLGYIGVGAFLAGALGVTTGTGLLQYIFFWPAFLCVFLGALIFG